MVLAIHYCLVNHIQFVLESENANFSSGKGWTEYFEPFCKEKHNKLLRKYNQRIKPAYSNKIDWLEFNLYKRMHPSQLYMYALFNKIREVDPKQIFTIPELNLNGSLLENCSEIHKMIWRYNRPTETTINAIIKGCQLPSSYVGVHIRQGDKWTESKMYSPDEYMQCVKANSSEQNLFVLTDDYRVIEELESHYSQHAIYTLCKKHENGYNFQKMKQMTFEEKANSFLRLWASMDILEHSSLFVGTYSANPGMNMGFRISADSIICLDFKEWQLW